MSPGDKDFWVAPGERVRELNAHINAAAGIALPEPPHNNTSQELEALAHGLASIAGDPLINVLIAEAASTCRPSAGPATDTTSTPGHPTDIPDLSMRIADAIFCLVGSLLRKELGRENGKRFNKGEVVATMRRAQYQTAPRVFAENAKALQDVPKPKEQQQTEPMSTMSSADGAAPSRKLRSTADGNNTPVVDNTRGVEGPMESESGREDTSQEREQKPSSLRKRGAADTKEDTTDTSEGLTQPKPKKKRTTSQEMPNVEFSVGSVSFTGKTKQMKIKIITEDGTTTKNPCDILGASTVIDAIFQNQASKLKFCRYMYDAEVDWQRRQAKLQSQPEKAEVAGDKQKELNRLLADKEALDNKIATLRQSLEPQQ